MPEANLYLPTVAWRTLISNVILLTAETEEDVATYRVSIDPIDINEPGGLTGEVDDIDGNNYYLKDFLGHTYKIIAKGTGTVDVSDDFRTGHGAVTGRMGVIYKSVGDGTSPYLAPVYYKYLDSSARDYSRRFELDILWKNAGIQNIGAELDPVYPISYIYYIDQYGDKIYVTEVPKPNGLIWGGRVSWFELLKFDVTAAIYYLEGELYKTVGTRVTLDAADATYDRIDLIVVDDQEVVSFIKGVPSANPQKPTIDVTTQVEITNILVKALGTEPDPLPTDEVIYDEGSEWAITSNIVLIDTASVADKYHGNVSIGVSDTINEDYILFTSSSALNKNDYENLIAELNLKAKMDTRKTMISVQFFLAGSSVSNSEKFTIDGTLTDWQTLIIPISRILFFGGEQFDAIKIEYTNLLLGTHGGFYLDYIRLQSGVVQPPIVDNSIELTGDVTGSGYLGIPIPTTLATVNSNVGQFGDESNIPKITVDAKGRVTAIENVPVTIPDDNYVDGASYSEVTHDLTLTRTGTLEDIVVNIPCCGSQGMIDGAISNVKYGYLYNWWAAVDARNIAPAGWHVPTYEEWNTLDNYLGGWTTAGGKLKETGTTYWETPNTGATNEVGFNLRGSGWRVNTGYNSIKYASRYWCYNLIFGLSYQFGVAYNSVQHESTDRPSYEGLSLRLIKDDQNDTGTMTGNDGKVYPTVTIGTQVWMAANLMETKYRDGSPISGPTFTNAEWAALTTEAYCIYEDDPTNAGDEDEVILQHNLLGGLQGGSATERHHHTKAEIDTHVYEALEDGKYYARKDGAWAEVVTGGLATVETDMSVIGDGTADAPITLVNDEESPGNSEYYGTNASGAKGYHALPEGGGGASAFTDLTDTPASYSGAGGKIVAVNSGASALEFIDAPSGGGDDEKVKYNASDVASGYLADKVVAGTGIALAEGTSGDADKLQVSLNATFLNLTDTPSAYTGLGEEVVSVKSTVDGLETTPVIDYDFSDLFITKFTDLTDTPSDLSILDGEVVVVNAAGTALETEPTVEVGWAETTGHPVTTDTVLVLTFNGQAYQINVKKV